MRGFGYFLERGDVRKQSRDPSLSRALVKRAKERLEFAKVQKITEATSTFIVEEVYEAIRELVDAKLFLDGYKSYSHEASIVYLNGLQGIGEADIARLDSLRKSRNSSKYYGKHMPVNAARDAIRFAEHMFPKLTALCLDA